MTLFKQITGKVTSSSRSMLGVVILGAGQNFVIKVTLMLVDLILDIAFVVTSGKDVSWLYWPRLFPLPCDPLCINSLIIIILLISEINENENFHILFRSYSKPAALLTILAATDVETITLMSSKLFGFQIFSAQFSTKVEIWTFWAGFYNLFIEDASQLIIQKDVKEKNPSYIPIVELSRFKICIVPESLQPGKTKFFETLKLFC
ncbi:9499_t:CDS:2 [Funneliformis geosporum]|uniref:9499_t:CDS:1 n=1 Tax=Funneliformis geosporum TaxID=1117311 RepID=A0A9W4SVY1_9GLOM|nr:9499_t:CDS:2 [Funneliformis geosporum]